MDKTIKNTAIDLRRCSKRERRILKVLTESKIKKKKLIKYPYLFKGEFTVYNQMDDNYISKYHLVDFEEFLGIHFGITFKYEYHD